MDPKKELVFWSNQEAVLAGSGSTTLSITADRSERLVIERFITEVRTTAGYAVADHLNMVNISDTKNGSYTRGEVPLYAVAGKASVSIPVFLPRPIIIEPGQTLSIAIRNVSSTAETVELSAVGSRQVP